MVYRIDRVLARLRAGFGIGDHVDDSRLSRGEGALQCRPDASRLLHKLGVAAEGGRHQVIPAVAELGFHCADPKIAQLPQGQFGQILAESVAAADALGVETLVTIYHACHRELVPVDSADEAVGDIRIENYVTLLARALGLAEHPDRFKHFVRLGSPGAILAELEPRIEQLGVSRERVERAVSAQFGTQSALAAATH